LRSDFRGSDLSSIEQQIQENKRMAENQTVTADIDSGLLSVVEFLKLEAARKSMESVNFQMQAINANMQTLQVQAQGLQTVGKAAEKRVRDVIAQIEAAHPELYFNPQVGEFALKPTPPAAPAVPEALPPAQGQA
jgi:septal ring factor EnvC (AmiA/AmiB activator)